MPLTDGTRPRRFPYVTALLIAANLIVWIFYELPHLDAAAAQPVLGASGAIAAVLGAYGGLYPDARILTLVGVFFIRVRAASFAHIGGFVLGVIAATMLTRSGTTTRRAGGAAA